MLVPCCHESYRKYAACLALCAAEERLTGSWLLLGLGLGRCQEVKCPRTRSRCLAKLMSSHRQPAGSVRLTCAHLLVSTGVSGKGLNLLLLPRRLR